MNVHKNARWIQLGRERLARMMLNGRFVGAAIVCVDLPPVSARR